MSKLIEEASDEWLALDWLLTRIGSWTHSRWDQHLRDRFGDVRTDEIIEAFGYKKRPAGEAPVARALGIEPCAYDRAPLEGAANSLWCHLADMGITFSGVSVTNDHLIVYVRRLSKKSKIPDRWGCYRVVTQRLSAIKPAK